METCCARELPWPTPVGCVSLGMGGLEIHSLDKLARREARILWPLTTDPQSRVVSVD